MNFKKSFLSKCMATVTSFVLLASVSSISPISPSASSAKNLISNGTFETGISGWGMYKESGGSATLASRDGKLALDVKSVGTLTYAVQMYYDIVPLYKNGVYRLKYDISSTVPRQVEAMIQQNGGTYQAYTWKMLTLTTAVQSLDYTFTMEADTDIMAKLAFNCGNEGVDLPEHTVYLDNVSLELIDDSKVNYSDATGYEPSIMINQVGYKPNSKKIAVFRNVTSQTSFSVINADTKLAVYNGTLYGQKLNSSANETNYYGDFSSVKDAGKYYIKCSGLDDSYTFTVSDKIYNNLLDDSVRMLYLQRCGTAIVDSKFSHPTCHTSLAKVHGTNQTIDVSGGWHDAGDYGRYVVPAAKTVADLLYAYQANPALYGDNTNIPESGNGIPDILDEVRFELKWMLKMQDSASGGVYHKVSCANFPGYIMPEAETGQLIVTPISTTATGDFCASMAMAYEFYYSIDRTFANTCLDAAKKAWGYLQSNPNLIFTNPADVVTGEYGDNSDSDERYWAAAQMYRATGEAEYLNAFEKMTSRTGLDWSTVGDYGNIAYLTMKNADKSSALYTKVRNAVISQADTMALSTSNSAYGVAISKFNWGSNMTVANAGIILGLAYQLTGDAKYLDGAESNLNYLLGRNPNAFCYVTGYGTVSPQNPHHRPSMAKGQAMKGMLVGGVNSNLEDSAAKAYLANSPAAKCYVDHSESYSTNEITIYWNSPLTYLLTLTEVKSLPVAKNVGDVNDDGKIDSNDIKMLQEYILGKITSLPKSENADLDGDSVLTASDIAILRQKCQGGNVTVTATTTPIPPTATTTTTTATATTTLPDINSKPNVFATLYANFRVGASSLFEEADGWSNGDCFDCVWRKSNVTFSGNAMNLTINKDTSGTYRYSGAEYRSKNFYQYGYYETSMQAIKNDGVVSSFFTYTGPSDGNPWDEIDIEILGKDTTKVQFNYYTNGVGNHEFMYNLGFDASTGFHTYGFDWQPNSITWYVDGKAVHTATSNIPKTPSKIMMNVWPGIGVNEWLKAFDGKTPLTAKYEWVTFNAK